MITSKKIDARSYHNKPDTHAT